jgi:hypothetical protein
LVQKLIALKFKQKVLIFRKNYTPKFLGCYSVDVYNEDILEDTVVFYEPGTPNATIMNSLAAGLRHHPAAINNIIRHTFMPKSGNKDKIFEHY